MNKDSIYTSLKFYAKMFYYISLAISLILILVLSVNSIKTIPALLLWTGVRVNKVAVTVFTIFFAIIFGIFNYLLITYIYLWLSAKIQYFEDIHNQVKLSANISNIIKRDSDLKERVYGSKNG